MKGNLDYCWTLSVAQPSKDAAFAGGVFCFMV